MVEIVLPVSETGKATGNRVQRAELPVVVPSQTLHFWSKAPERAATEQPNTSSIYRVSTALDFDAAGPGG